MISLRCKLVVKEELQKLGITKIAIELGVIEFMEPISNVQMELFKTGIAQSGLEVLDDKKAILVEKIKNVITEMIHHTEILPKTNYSDYLSTQLNYDYTYLSNIFAEVKGVTIQQFIIIHKIERIKELLLYNELNIGEIAYRLHYSSIAHLSNQFKKMTGFTPSAFKKLKLNRKSNLENM